MCWQQLYYWSSIGDCTIRVVYTIRVVWGGDPTPQEKICTCNYEKVWYNNNVH